MRLESYRNYHYFLMVQLVASGLLRWDLIIYLALAWWRPVLLTVLQCDCRGGWGGLKFRVSISLNMFLSVVVSS